MQVAKIEFSPHGTHHEIVLEKDSTMVFIKIKGGESNFLLAQEILKSLALSLLK
jgi:hypothetical protein